MWMTLFCSPAQWAVAGWILSLQIWQVGQGCRLSYSKCIHHFLQHHLTYLLSCTFY